MPITKFFKAKRVPISACANLDYYIVANGCFVVKYEGAANLLTMKHLSSYLRA